MLAMIMWANKFIKWLVSQDQWLFLYVNRIFTNATLDAVFPIWRDQQTWYPFYLFLFVFTLVNFGKKVWVWAIFFGLTIALCDQLSSHFIKGFVARPRPCSDPQFSQYVRVLLNRCPGNGSFTSSHAANHFGMVIFMVKTFGSFIGKWKYALYAWAVSICYAQVYVGVHYPLDVIGGGLIGSLIGYLTATYYNLRLGPLTLNSPVIKTIG